MIVTIYGLVQAWRVTHLPKRGRFGARPLVHSGFNKSWTSKAFSRRVVDRVLQIIRDAPSTKTPDTPYRVIITGAAYVLSIFVSKLRASTHMPSWIGLYYTYPAIPCAC